MHYLYVWACPEKKEEKIDIDIPFVLCSFLREVEGVEER